MSDLDMMSDQFERRFGTNAVAITPPLHSHGYYHLDLTVHDRLFVVLWAEDMGFGITAPDDDISYGEAPARHVTTLEEAMALLDTLIDEQTKRLPK